MQLDVQVSEEDHDRAIHEGHCEDAQDQGKEEGVNGAVIEYVQQDEDRV